MRRRLKFKLYRYMKNQHKGVITLTIATGILLAATLISMTSSKVANIDSQMVRNEYASKQAFEAAEAGIEYAQNYINKNQSMLDTAMNHSTGYLDTNLAKLQMAQNNGSNVLVTYKNSGPHDKSILTISAKGLSKDGTILREIKQKLQFKSFLKPSVIPSVPVVVRSTVDVSGNPTVRNPNSLIAIWSGDNVSLKGSAEITNSESDTSKGKNTKNNANNTLAAIQSNDKNLSTTSDNQFFRNFFGDSKDNLKRYAQSYFSYQQASMANLDGIKNNLVWIDGDLSLGGNGLIGTPNEPVILVVEGDFNLRGNTTINGFVYVTGTFDSGIGNSTINGSIAVQGNAILRGNTEMIFDASIIQTLGNTQGTYVSIPGSWKDS